MRIGLSFGGSNSIKSKLAAAAIMAIFIIVGIVLLNQPGNNADLSRYKTVEAQVEYVNTEIHNLTEINYVHGIVYEMEGSEYVYEYVTENIQYFTGQKVLLKVDTRDYTKVEITSLDGYEVGFSVNSNIIIGWIFIVVGIVCIVLLFVKRKKTTNNAK